MKERKLEKKLILWVFGWREWENGKLVEPAFFSSPTKILSPQFEKKIDKKWITTVNNWTTSSCGNNYCTKITSELHDSNTQKSLLRNKKEKRPNREHRCGAGRIPSEGQVRTILTTLEC